MNIYRERLLDHYKNPRNFDKPIDHNAIMELENVSCGDKIEMKVKITKDDKIENVSFSGEGCAIAIASSSIITELAINKSVDEINSITEEDLMEELGVELTVSRIKCALLGLESLKNALKRVD